MKARIELGFVQHAHATIYIEATSLEEARELAEEIDPGEVPDWNYFDGAIFVNDVAEASPADEGLPLLSALAKADPELKEEPWT